MNKPELFQVSCAFGNFESREEAEDFAKFLHQVNQVITRQIPGIIPSSISIKGSFSPPERKPC